MICRVCKEDHRTLVNKEWCDRSLLEIESDYLKAENARLREALKEIAEKIDCTCRHCVGCDQGFKMIYVAEEALKGGQ